LVAIAGIALEDSLSIGKELAREANGLALACQSGDMAANRRRLVDYAYQSDPRLANAVVEVVDTDGVR
jgi:hypothetical protein